MKKGMFAAALAACCFTAAAADPEVVDFESRLVHFYSNYSTIGPPQLVAPTTIHNAALAADGSIGIRYVVTDDNGATVFDNVATIDAGEETAVVGTAATGKLRLNYDPAIDELVARYTWTIQGTFSGPRFHVFVQQAARPWHIDSEIVPGIVF